MKILIMHHLEPMWDSALKNYGTSFEELQLQLLDDYESGTFDEYDRVILTRFEDWELDESYYGFMHSLVSEVYDYGYGWDIDSLVETDLEKRLAEKVLEFDGCVELFDTYCQGGNHSEIVLVADWMKDLENHDVTICGAFDGECLEDLEIALNFLEVDFKRWEKYIV